MSFSYANTNFQAKSAKSSNLSTQACYKYFEKSPAASLQIFLHLTHPPLQLLPNIHYLPPPIPTSPHPLASPDFHLECSDAEQDSLPGHAEAGTKHRLEVRLVTVLPETRHLASRRHLHAESHVRACSQRVTESGVRNRESGVTHATSPVDAISTPRRTPASAVIESSCSHRSQSRESESSVRSQQYIMRARRGSIVKRLPVIRRDSKKIRR